MTALTLVFGVQVEMTGTSTTTKVDGYRVVQEPDTKLVSVASALAILPLRALGLLLSLHCLLLSGMYSTQFSVGLVQT